MTGHVVELVCDRGVWHERKDGQRRYWVLACFVRRSSRSTEGVLWEIMPGRECPQDGGVSALRWKYSAPKYEARSCPTDDPLAAELSKYVSGDYSFPPCRCGFPSPTWVGIHFVEYALEQCRSAGKTRVSVSEFVSMAASTPKAIQGVSGTPPLEELLCVHKPASDLDWQSFYRAFSSGSSVLPEPPDDRQPIEEGQHRTRVRFRAVILMCDGGSTRKDWHRRRGAHHLATLELDDGGGVLPEPRPVIVDELTANEWDLYPSEKIDTETLGGLTFFPCPCGRRDLPLLDVEAAGVVAGALSQKGIRVVTIDEFAYMVKHAPKHLNT